MLTATVSRVGESIPSIVHILVFSIAPWRRAATGGRLQSTAIRWFAEAANSLNARSPYRGSSYTGARDTPIPA
jgi:hypothetical protein